MLDAHLDKFLNMFKLPKQLFGYLNILYKEVEEAVKSSIDNQSKSQPKVNPSFVPSTKRKQHPSGLNDHPSKNHCGNSSRSRGGSSSNRGRMNTNQNQNRSNEKGTASGMRGKKPVHQSNRTLEKGKGKEEPLTVSYNLNNSPVFMLKNTISCDLQLTTNNNKSVSEHSSCICPKSSKTVKSSQGLCNRTRKRSAENLPRTPKNGLHVPTPPDFEVGRLETYPDEFFLLSAEEQKRFIFIHSNVYWLETRITNNVLQNPFDISLTESTKRFLTLDSKFCLKPRYKEPFKILNSWKDFSCSVCIQCFYSDMPDDDEFVAKFHLKSHVPFDTLEDHPDVEKGLQTGNSLLQLALSKIKTNNLRPSISTDRLQSFDQFITQIDYIFKPCNKNLGMSILPSKWYVRECNHSKQVLQHLQHLLFDPADQIWLASQNGHTKDESTVLSTSLEFILKNNYLAFGSNVYRQVKGTAMDTACAPTFANLHAAAYESLTYDSRPNSLLYIPAVSQSSIPFLNVKLQVKERTDTLERSILTSVFQKPFNAYQYIPWSSYHPPRVKLAFIKGELLSQVLFHPFDSIYDNWTSPEQPLHPIQLELAGLIVLVLFYHERLNNSSFEDLTEPIPLGSAP
ncbi:hypothetical protein H4Q26_010368 [Puccinia striiformis f. sp. tritici PST-130]|nr:hypothetical protein H4Q26_010368 [Puccinia striiformis f. sp. tritici PST-130]